MPTISTQFTSPHAGKYLTQLCKHFAHKVDVTFDDDTHARVSMPNGTARFSAEDDKLYIGVDVNSPENVQQVIYVIEIHLLRFAWREPVDIVWRDADGNAIERSQKLEEGLKEQREKNAARQKA